MAVKRYNGSDWDTVAGVGAQGATGASGTAPLTTKGDLLGFDTAANRVAVGTDGQVLTADSTAATGVAWSDVPSGYTKIQTSTFSAVSDTGTTFDGVFTSTYSNYVVVIKALSSATEYLRFRFRVGATTRTTDYFGSTAFDLFGGTTDRQNANNGASCVIAYPSGYSGFTTVNVGGVGNASERAFIYGNGFGTQNTASVTFGYQQDVSATYTGFILSAATGTITGTATIYGLAK